MQDHFVNWLEQKSWLVGLGITIFAYATLYGITNRMPTIYGPFEFNLFFNETNIPFVPWTAIIYISIFVFLSIAGYFLPQKVFAQTVVVCLYILVFHTLIFLFFPTTYPREDMQNPGGFLGWLIFNVIHNLDAPRNCYPSLHVSLPFTLSFIWLRYRPKIGVLFLVWAIVIALSTLTTKQHYILDVLGGIIVAYIFTCHLPRFAHNPSIQK
jgi:membrane-associated phospholipid phosphatase